MADTTLDSDLTCSGNGLVIVTDGITLDCNGRSVTGSGFGGGHFGIELVGRTGVTVKNCHVTAFGEGFFLQGSSGNTLKGNTANGNSRGFHLISGSSSNTLEGNTANGNFDIGFVLSSESSGNTLKGNTANGNFDIGIHLKDAFGNTLEGNKANENSRGFHLIRSSGNTLAGNKGNDNSDVGFSLEASENNLLERNTARGNGTVDARQINCVNNKFVDNNFGTTRASR